MKKILNSALIFTLLGFAAGCGSKQETSATVGAVKEQAPVVAAAADEEMKVELGCAMCIYEQEGADRCLTAAKVGDQVLMVDSDLDAHKAGLCKAARNATVMAHIEGDRLVASSIELN